MSGPSRREKIEAMLVDDPRDVFLRYGLAQEWFREGRHDTGLDILAELTRGEPPYVPAFFRSAQQLVDLGRIEEARERLRAGIDQARLQGNSHAAGEMSELLTSLGQISEDF